METFENLSLRNVINAIRKTKLQVCTEPIIKVGGRIVKLHLGLLQVLVILRRIGLDNKTIMSDFSARIEKQNEDLMSYFCSYMALCTSLPVKGMIFHDGLRENCNAIEYGDLRDDGMMGKIRLIRLSNPMPRSVDFEVVVEKMLDYVAI